MSDDVTRRTFIRTGAAGVSAAVMGLTGTARGFAANGKLRLGWIGVGGRGIQLINEVLAQGRDAIHSVAVCDLLPERIKAAQDLLEADAPTGYTDVREMLEKERLDAAIISTTPNTHADISIAVIEAGVHCFCEKPMDTTVEKVDAVVRVARASRDVIYQIGTQRRYNPGFVSAMPFIQSAEFGRVTFMQGQWHWPWLLYKHPVERTGGMYLDQAAHHFDVMAWAMGEQHPATCSAMGYSQDAESAGPNAHSATHVATMYAFPDGQIFSYTHLFCLPLWFQSEQLRVFGENGGVDLVQGMFHRYLPPGTPPPEDEESAGVRKRVGESSGTDWNKGTGEQLVDFFDNVRTGGRRKPKANIETGRVATLMGIMGRMAMVNATKNAYEPRIVRWEDLGSTT